MEKYGLPSTAQFGNKLTEIADYAFSHGMNSIPNAQKQKSGASWDPPEMALFMNESRKGFKLAQKLLIDQVLYYQQKLKENQESLKAFRSNHNKSKTQEYVGVGKVITRRLNNLSHIADGLVIQMLGQQVHIARRLHIGEKSNKRLEHSNLEHAIKVANQLNADPSTFALISDLSSYVQIGDLLVTDEKKGFYITELKEGKTNEKIRNFIDSNLKSGEPFPALPKDFSDKEVDQMQRMLRQDLRALQATEIINTDKGTDPETGANITVNTPTIDLDYYDAIFPEMIEELATRDWSYRKLDNCLHIGIYQGKMLPDMAQFAIPTLLKTETQDYIVIDLMQITEELSETLFSKPLSKEFVVKIMTGETRVIIGINLDELIDVFNANGLKTSWLTTKETAKIKSKNKKIQIVTSKNRGIGIELPSGNQAVMSGGIISKIGFDNILPSSLAKSMATSRQPTPQKPTK